MTFSPRTSKSHSHWLAALALFSVAALGCSSSTDLSNSSGSPGPSNGSDASDDSDTSDASDDSSNDVAQEFPAQAFATVTSDSGKLSFELRSKPQPVEQGANELLLTVHDTETDEARDDLTFTVEPWMPHHGHGSSAVPQVSSVGDGHYLVKDVVFTMPGDWELRIHITAPFEDALAPTVIIQ